MPDEYGNIEVTDDEMASLTVEKTPSLNQSDSETKPSNEEVSEVSREESNEIEQEAPITNDSEDEEYELHVGEDVFSIDDVLGWKKDSDNKSNWNKSNTQKAQAIAKGGRLLKLLDNDDSFRDHIKEFFYGEEKEIKKYGLDNAYDVDFDDVQKQEPTPVAPQVPQEDPRMTQLLDRVEGVEDEKLGRSIGDRYDSIKSNNPNFFREEKDGVNFLVFCEENGVIENNDIDMEKTFKLWSYDRVMTEENRKEQLYNNKLRNEGSTVGSSEVGAKEVRSGDSPKNYNEISMDNPEITRYFNS